MSAFRVNVVAVNPKNEDVVTEPISALVDTGSELTWLPAGDLSAIGITPRRKRTFVTASGDRLQREVGYAIVRAEGYETTDEVVFGVKGDQVLLGICCGQEYVAERSDQPAIHENPSIHPQHNCLQSQGSEEGPSTPCFPSTGDRDRALRRRRAPLPWLSSQDRSRRRCWWYRGSHDPAKRGLYSGRPRPEASDRRSYGGSCEA